MAPGSDRASSFEATGESSQNRPSTSSHTRQSPAGRKKLLDDLDDDLNLHLDRSDDEDVKPVIGPSRKSTEKEVDLGFMELSSDSEPEDGRRAPNVKQSSSSSGTSHAALSALRECFPDIDPQYLVALFHERERNQEVVADELMRTNYRLRGGGWKFGRAPTPEQEEQGEEEDELDELEREYARTTAQQAVEAGNKDKSGKAKARKAPSPSPEEEDEDEEDQLASGAEDEDADGDPRFTYTAEEALDDEEYWLDPEGRKPGGEKYHKAALEQLFRDYDEYTESHLRQLFDQAEMLYAPAWFASLALKKQSQLVKLRGNRRDMEHVRDKDGKLKERKSAESSRLLEQEVAWLEAYLAGGNTKRGLQVIADRHSRDPPAHKKQKHKESKEQRLARTHGDAGGSGAGKKQPKAAPKKGGAKKAPAKRARQDTDDDDNDDDPDDFYDAVAEAHRVEMAADPGRGPNGAIFNKASSSRGRKRSQSAACQGKYGGGAWSVKQEPGVEAFSGQGFRLGD
ncbi:uncharacterized protein JCM10292_002917 [Rhodotorula paludigena]|uniref:uncharacterized protein n=1 Tax=Rhodotorula paludigena TaxID=86838 RepID=UPI0031703F5C